MRERRNRVAIIGTDHHARLAPIGIAGAQAAVRIATGLGEGARVASGLPDGVADGPR
jgi:hypothetical protein